MCAWCLFFFFKQKTAYEMRISDWSSDVCSSDLPPAFAGHGTFVSKESQISNVTGQRDRKAARVSARLLAGASLGAVVLLAMASPAQAQDADRNWDANGTAVGSGGTGTWNLGNLNWKIGRAPV